MILTITIVENATLSINDIKHTNLNLVSLCLVSCFMLKIAILNVVILNVMVLWEWGPIRSSTQVGSNLVGK